MAVAARGTIEAVTPKCAFANTNDVDGNVIIQPSSIKGIGQKWGGEYPSLANYLRKHDHVQFLITRQPEYNGVKWRCVDESVVVEKRPEMYESDGTITGVDQKYGRFGFIESKRGGVYFNSNSILPKTGPEQPDASKLFKVGQKVHFKALPKNDHKNPWKAFEVYDPKYKPLVQKEELVSTKYTAKARPIEPVIPPRSFSPMETASSISSEQNALPEFSLNNNNVRTNETANVWHNLADDWDPDMYVDKELISLAHGHLDGPCTLPCCEMDKSTYDWMRYFNK